MVDTLSASAIRSGPRLETSHGRSRSSPGFLTWRDKFSTWRTEGGLSALKCCVFLINGQRFRRSTFLVASKPVGRCVEQEDGPAIGCSVVPMHAAP